MWHTLHAKSCYLQPKSSRLYKITVGCTWRGRVNFLSIMSKTHLIIWTWNVFYIRGQLIVDLSTSSKRYLCIIGVWAKNIGFFNLVLCNLNRCQGGHKMCVFIKFSKNWEWKSVWFIRVNCDHQAQKPKLALKNNNWKLQNLRIGPSLRYTWYYPLIFDISLTFDDIFLIFWPYPIFLSHIIIYTFGTKNTKSMKSDEKTCLI